MPILHLLRSASCRQMPVAPILLFKLERLYESCKCLSLGAKPFPGLSPRQGRQNSTSASETSLFRKFRSFSASCPDTSLLRDFSKTHRWTQRIHSWIGLELLEVGKLLRSQTNSQILSNLHFCEPFTPIFDKHV